MERSIIIFLLALSFLVVDNGVKVAASLQDFAYIQSIPTEQPYRTTYHFQPPRFWMNDPNGLMYYNGVYHLFYQHNPYSPLFSDSIYWAHSVSYDLINWIHLDIAISPTDPFDINSCWSGSATILPGNKPVILYTGIDSQNRQVQNLVTPKNLSDPFLQEWVKYAGNPVINLPDGIKPNEFRDPSTGWLGSDGKWRIIVGSNKNKEGFAFIYKSEDFFNWTKYDYPLYSTQGTGIWECPDFYPVPINSTNGVDTSVMNPRVKHVMKMGFLATLLDYYLIGTYHPERENYLPQNYITGSSLDLRYDYGKFYASKSFFDNVKNRRILWAWVNESDSQQDDIEKGWSGLQSFPRTIWLDRNGKQLVQWPVKEIETLHENEVSFHGEKLEGGSLFEVVGINGSQADVMISFKVTNLEEAEIMDSKWINEPQLLCSEKNAASNGKFGPFGLLAFASENLTEQTAIFFRIFNDHGRYLVLMCSDQSRSSVRDGLDKTTYGAFVDINPQFEEISLRSLIDHSIVESFGGGGKTCITARVYPKFAINKEAHLFAFNNGTQSVVISKLNAWSMKKAQINAEETIMCMQ